MWIPVNDTMDQHIIIIVIKAYKIVGLNFMLLLLRIFSM